MFKHRLFTIILFVHSALLLGNVYNFGHIDYSIFDADEAAKGP